MNSLASSPKLKGEEVTVPVLTLDELAEKYVHPDFVKIDVEGGEQQVLEGMSGVLQNSPEIMLEVHGSDDNEVRDRLADHDGDVEKIHDLLTQHGYQIYSIGTDGTLTEITDEDSFDMPSHWYATTGQ